MDPGDGYNKDPSGPSLCRTELPAELRIDSLAREFDENRAHVLRVDQLGRRFKPRR